MPLFLKWWFDVCSAVDSSWFSIITGKRLYKILYPCFLWNCIAYYYTYHLAKDICILIRPFTKLYFERFIKSYVKYLV